ncbi:MAG: MBG domain-containing protein [Bryobacteraceae bacterium]
MSRECVYNVRDRFLTQVVTSTALLTLTFLAPFAPLAQGADALKYDKNYFVTGDYTVAGVGLRGTGVKGVAKGNITITGVPCTSGVGALTYEPCSTPGAVASDIVAAFLYWETEEATQNSSASGYFDGKAITGAAIGNSKNASCEGANGAAGPPGTYGHVYRADVLPLLQVDTTNNIRLANGTHTVNVGADSGQPNGALPHTNGASLVVVYKVVVPGNPLIAPLKSVVLYDGAYTMATGTPAFTQTIGGFYQATGFGATMAQIVSNGQSNFAENLSVNGTVISTSPFTGKSGVRWDNPTFGISLAPNAATYSTQVTSGNGQVCLTWAAVVTSTPVVDSDYDGLLDVWETKGIHLNTGTSTTPATFGGCSDYPADPCVNLPAMGANPLVRDVFVQIDWMHGYVGEGSGGTDGGGSHDHKPTQNALNMVCSTFAIHGIAMHFDVGNNYQGQPCIIPANDSHGNQLAQGGSDIPENSLLCPNAATSTCTYTETFPVLSFKRGFISVRDGDPTLNLPAHFSHERKDSFHYVLFTHALAGPFGATGAPLTKDPTSVSGIADRPGGDVMVTLGLWRTDVPTTDQVGTDLIQAGTLMHELGHNFDLSHYGLNRTPNCAPQYASVMNYLYQTRGLTDAFGNEHIDYSYGLVSPALSENNPTHILFPLLYRIRYYAPLNSAVNTAGQAAKVFCSGAPITNGALAIRLESSGLSAPDWSNGTGDTASPPLDLNFDGVFGQTFHDQPDWSSLNLQQVGGRPNANGASGDVGFADEGFADEGFADEGFADEGFADEGFADEGITDGDVDLNTNILSGAPLPTSLTATNTINSIQLAWLPPSAGQVSYYNIYRCAIIAPTTSCTLSTTPFKTAAGGTATPGFTDTVNDTTDSGAGGSAACSTSTCYNTTYTYQVTAVISAAGTPAESGPTNTATSEVTHLFVVGNSQTLVYGATALPIPNPTYTVYGDVSSSLTSGVTCVYAPASPRNVGTYSIVCSGPATTSATDGVTYNAAYLSYTPGVLTITQRSITVTAAASSKVYDGGLTSTATPTITTGSLAYGDSVTWTETYDNLNVGTTHVMTPAGVVNDGNSGNNYKIAFVTISTGIITPAPLTARITGSQTYGGTALAYVPSYTGLVGGDTSSVVTGTLTCSTNATSASPLGNSYTISNCSGLTASNYTISYSYGTFTVNPAPLTANITGSQTYGGTNPSFTPAYVGLVNNDPSSVVSGTLTCGDTATAASPVTGSYSTSGCSGLTASNYTISYSYGAFTVNPASLTANITGSQTYGGANPSFTPAYVGLVNSDPSSVVSGTLSCGDTATAASPVTGSYSTSGCLGLTTVNYTIKYSYGTFTINPAPLTANITGSQTYGGTNKGFSVSGYGPPSFVNGDSSSVVSGTLTCSSSAALTVGSYGNAISGCTGLTAANYTISYAPGNFTVNAASLTISVTGSEYYMGPATFMASNYSGFTNGDTASVLTGTLTCTVTPGMNVGVYANAISGCGGLAAANYTIGYASGNFTVGAASQSITFAPLSSEPFGIADFTVSATATSGLGVTFTATGNCTVTPAGLVHLVSTGICNVTAAQTGGLDYQPATSVTQSFTITAIDFTTLVLGGSPSAVSTATTTGINMTSSTNQTAAAWLPAPLPVGSAFTTQFSFQISASAPGATIADGFAFVIQNSLAGTGALGTTGMGGFLGYQGLTNSLAVEFDTYQNDWDPNANHVAIQSNYTGANSASHNGVDYPTPTISAVNTVAIPTLAEGSHTVIITYDGSTLTVSLDRTSVVSASVNLSNLGLDPNGNAVVGFTAATGDASQVTQISSWSFTSN